MKIRKLIEEFLFLLLLKKAWVRTFHLLPILNLQQVEQDINGIVSRLKEMNWERSFIIDENNRRVQLRGDWEYNIDQDVDMPYCIDIDGPFDVQVSKYNEVGLLFTDYKYSMLYELSRLDWAEEFRRRLYEITKILDGSEVIALADNGCDTLCDYYSRVVNEAESYDEIKKREFGIRNC